MVHRNLLIYALVLSVSFAGTAAGFLRAETVSAQTGTASPKPSVSASSSPTKPSVSPSVSPSVDPSASPTVSPSPSPSSSPTPEPAYQPVGDKIRLWQLRWLSAKKTNQAVAPVVKKTKKEKTEKTSWLAAVARAAESGGMITPEDTARWRSDGTITGTDPDTFGLNNTQAGAAAAVGAGVAAIGGNKDVQTATNALGLAGSAASLAGAGSIAGPLFIGAAAVGIFGTLLGSFFGGEKKPPNRVQTCVKKEFKTGNHSQWSSYYEIVDAKIENGGEYITGKKKVDESYVISNIFTAAKGDVGHFTDLTILYDKPEKNTLKISYRASNEPLPAIHKPEDWIELPDPEISNSKNCSQKVRIAKYPLDVTKKYFQYKVNVVKGQQFRAAWFDIQGMKDPSVKPSPEPTASGEPPKETENGLLTISTKKLVTITATPTPSTALLPPSPSPSATPSNLPAKPNPACFNNQNTEPAANVPISLRQIEGGSTKIEDEQTDEDGLWSGVNESQDDFPVGTYLLKWGEFEKNDYKLVDICVSPNDGTNVKYSQTSLTGDARATFNIKKGQETKITLLYGKRDNPYIAMTKFAVNRQNKIIRLIYPGSNFRYLIRYENTGEADAENVVIRDVIPEQLYVVGSESQAISQKAAYEVELDALGRTIITRRLGKLTKGQRGSLIIPVIARPKAFGLPEDPGQSELAEPPASDPAGGSLSGQPGEQSSSRSQGPSDRLLTDFAN